MEIIGVIPDNPEREIFFKHCDKDKEINSLDKIKLKTFLHIELNRATRDAVSERTYAKEVAPTSDVLREVKTLINSCKKILERIDFDRNFIKSASLKRGVLLALGSQANKIAESYELHGKKFRGYGHISNRLVPEERIVGNIKTIDWHGNGLAIQLTHHIGLLLLISERVVEAKNEEIKKQRGKEIKYKGNIICKRMTPYLCDIWENYMGRKTGSSITNDKEVVGPFVRFVSVVFSKLEQETTPAAVRAYIRRAKMIKPCQIKK